MISSMIFVDQNFVCLKRPVPPSYMGLNARHLKSFLNTLIILLHTRQRPISISHENRTFSPFLRIFFKAVWFA